MIRFASETVIPLTKVGDHIPPGRFGKRLHRATAFRWARYGLRGVKLETIRVGGRACTSLEALERFFALLTESAAPDNEDNQAAEPDHADGLAVAR